MIAIKESLDAIVQLSGFWTEHTSYETYVI